MTVPYARSLFMTDSTPQALVFAVVSGKGGAGKSTLAVNLAESLAGAGYRAALLDADLGQGSCSTLLNEAPAATATAFASGAVPLDGLLHATASGLTLVVGSTTEAPDAPDAPLFGALDAVLAHLGQSHDVVIVDAPAGMGPAVRWALDRADAGVLVLVGEPTAITAAYALAKMVWQAAPDYPFLSVVNAADTDADAAQTAERFAALTTQFLGAAPTPLGWIPYDAHVRAAVHAQTPAARLSPALRGAFGGLVAGLAPLLPPARLPIAA